MQILDVFIFRKVFEGGQIKPLIYVENSLLVRMILFIRTKRVRLNILKRIKITMIMIFLSEIVILVRSFFEIIGDVWNCIFGAFKLVWMNLFGADAKYLERTNGQFSK